MRLPLPRRRRRAATDRDVVVVLGMHRSGTSATAGVVGELGLELGTVSSRGRFNVKGNRENRELTQLHESILQRNGGAWWDPPAAIELTAGDRARRDEILAAYPAGSIAVKEPRLVLLLDLWRDLRLEPIGVIRNPVAVRRSLQARIRVRGQPEALLDDARCDALWRTYNTALLREHEHRPFPIVSFERLDEFPQAVRGALRHHGHAAEGSPTFFDDALPATGSGDWRQEIGADEAETLALWEQLDAVAERWRAEVLPTP